MISIYIGTYIAQWLMHKVNGIIKSDMGIKYIDLGSNERY